MTPTPLLAIALGWTAGMRSMTPPALLAHALSGTVRPRRQPARVLTSPLAQRLLPLAAGGELIADKLPITPARTSPPALAGRLMMGGVCGAAVAAARQEDWPLPAVLGAVAAGLSSVVMMRARADAARRWVLPDPAVALVEDGLALAGAGLAARAV